MARESDDKRRDIPAPRIACSLGGGRTDEATGWRASRKRRSSAGESFRRGYRRGGCGWTRPEAAVSWGSRRGVLAWRQKLKRDGPEILQSGESQSRSEGCVGCGRERKSRYVLDRPRPFETGGRK